MSGFVSLVGAGPGDEELISIKGARRLEEADVLIYDRLVNPMLLAYTKANCEKIYVGKIPNQPCVSQEKIEEVLVAKGCSPKKWRSLYFWPRRRGSSNSYPRRDSL